MMEPSLTDISLGLLVMNLRKGEVTHLSYVKDGAQIRGSFYDSGHLRNFLLSGNQYQEIPGMQEVRVIDPPIEERAKTCKKGKPCGNSCIANNKQCRVALSAAGKKGAKAAAQPPTPKKASKPSKGAATQSAAAPAPAAQTTGQQLAIELRSQIAAPARTRNFTKVLDLADQIYEEVKNKSVAETGTAQEFYGLTKAGNVTANIPSGDRSDPILSRLFSDIGYNGLPEVVGKKDIDADIAAGRTVFYRATSSTKKSFTARFDAFKYGDYFAGHGIYGHGTYVAAAQDKTPKARRFASGAASPYGSGVMRGTLKDGAIVVSATQAKKETNSFITKFRNWETKEAAKLTGQQLADFQNKARRARKVIYGDNGPPSGRFGALLGWDAISLKGVAYNATYTNLLNRTAVRIQGTDNGLNNI
ncbi:MAG: hypothetical protein HC934_02960 [Acaryochloridaceae cyanobacterium SU_2_1]|nr:hypothetical protein [Acaryochloridaceae cyanobacterium SU_2_1]